MADGILTPCNVARSRNWSRQVTAPCNVACGSGIVTVNLQVAAPCKWYVALEWHAIEFDQTSAILEFYIWFQFLHITSVDMSLYTSLRNFIQIGPPLADSFYPNRTTLGGLILSKSDHPWRTLCKHVTIGHFCCFDCLLTVFDDWYTVGTDSVPIVTGLPRLYQQCTNRQKQSKTVKRQSKQQKWTLVYQSSHVYQECTNRVPTVYQSLKTVKRQSKQQKWPLVYQSSHDTSTPQYIKTVPTVYHQCTNRQKQSKTVKRQSKTAKMTIGVPIVTYLPRLYQSSHVYTESAEYIKSASASASAWAVRVRVRRIHKAPIGHQ